MAGPCSENVLRPKSQDSTNMGRRGRPIETVAKNYQQGEGTSRIQDVEGRRGRGKRPSCLEEND